MPSRITSIVIDAVDPRVVADFWCEVLAWQVLDEEDDVIVIGPADGRWPVIDIAQVPEGKTLKNRLHLDLRADGVLTADEADRLRALGARPADVGQHPDADWWVLTDPEGNEFCLLSRPTQDLR